MADHQHHYESPPPGEAYLVIDTYPPMYPLYCRCGAVTHDPEDGEPCPICSARRTPPQPGSAGGEE